jgi:nicotinate-nucleotide adenylyltransferase
MRIGLFGGTFDPIHWGHLRSAEEVSETFGLDQVVFIAASIPPHKRGQTTTPARDRLEMVRLAVARIPGSRYQQWRFTGPAFPIPSIRCAISPEENAKAIRCFSLLVLMHLGKSDLGRISPRFFRSAISL